MVRIGCFASIVTSRGTAVARRSRMDGLADCGVAAGSGQHGSGTHGRSFDDTGSQGQAATAASSGDAPYLSAAVWRSQAREL